MQTHCQSIFSATRAHKLHASIPELFLSFDVSCLENPSEYVHKLYTARNYRVSELHDRCYSTGRAYSKDFLIIHTPMASAGARAYNGCLGAEPPAGIQGAGPPVGVRGLEADEVFVFKTVIFNASAIVFHEMTYCLSCFYVLTSMDSQSEFRL